MYYKNYYTKEPIIHSHISDYLPSDNPSAWKGIYCDKCKEEILHAANNRCMQTWIETEFGNFCTKCWKLSDMLEILEENLANEGYTESVIVAFDKDQLVKTIKDSYRKELESYTSDWSENNHGFTIKGQNTLIEMVNNHKNWSNGIHKLKNIEPHGQEWILVITDKPIGEVDLE